MAQVPRVERVDPFLDKELEGRFRVVARLGEGGMSAVYRAQQITGGPDVAIKVLNDELLHDQSQRERFEREARALFALQHPNVLNVYDYGVVNGVPFLVMELLEGQTLSELVEEGDLDPTEAVDLVRQVLAGLSFAHDQSVLHRDLKTENVWVMRAPNGQRVAKLLDFGLVKFVDDDRWGEGKQLTAFGEVFGTPAYMSPEQCTGAPVDARADVYAMGVVLFELLTGQWPFMEENRAEMMRAHLMMPPPSLAETRPELQVRPELEALVRKALAKERDHRFAHAREMLAALDAIPRPAARLDMGTAERADQAFAPYSPHAITDRTDPTGRPALATKTSSSSMVPWLVVLAAALVAILIVGAVLLYFALG